MLSSSPFCLPIHVTKANKECYIKEHVFFIVDTESDASRFAELIGTGAC